MKSQAVIEDALARMHREMSGEIARLRDLAEVNGHIKPEESAGGLTLPSFDQSAASTRFTAPGSDAAMRNSVLAAPLGRELPCSHL